MLTDNKLDALFGELRNIAAALYIMRHGITQDDVEKKWSGWDNVPLTAEGIAAVEKSAYALMPLGIKRIVCSHLYRTTQTAHIVANILGNIPVVEDWRLAAWNLGILAKQIEEHYKIQPYIDDPWTPIPGGESLNYYIHRFLEGMNDAERTNVLAGPTLTITHSSGVCVWEGGGDISRCSSFLQPGSVALSQGRGKKLKLVAGSMTAGDAA